MVPVGVDVTFSCEIGNGLNPHWNINNQALAFRDSVESISRQGFFISRQDKPDHHTTLILRVNATEERMNGTEIFCSSLRTHSNTAVLLTISGN